MSKTDFIRAYMWMFGGTQKEAKKVYYTQKLKRDDYFQRLFACHWTDKQKVFFNA